MNSKENPKKPDVKVLKDKKQNEYNIHTGWKQEWVSPKQLNSIRPIKICEVVRGPFYSPKLLKISPFVNLSTCREENGKMTRYKKQVYGGIPDPWTECLAIKGYCNEKQAKILRKSCVSRCMRFWITKTVWKEMGLPLIQGIPDPGRDYSDIEETYKRCLSKRQKRDASDTLPRSKSLPDSLEKLSTQKNITFSNTVPSSNLLKGNKNEGSTSFIEGTKPFKNPKVSNEQMNKIENTKKDHNHRRSSKNHSTQLRKAGGGSRVDSFSHKNDNVNIKTNARSDRAHRYPSLDIATQTCVNVFERVPCQESSLQAILKIAKNSIIPRKTYKALKNKWARMKDLSTLENANRYLSNVKPCRCKRVNNFITKIEEEKLNRLQNESINNYCAHCKRYILKNNTFDCRCHEIAHDYSRYKTRKNEKTRRCTNSCVLKKNPKPVQENAMIQTDLETVKELNMICARCNYPYLKTNTETEINASTMDYLVDRKNHTFVSNINDGVSHRFQDKHTENKSTVPTSSLRSTSKWDDLKYVKDDVQKTRTNTKETNVNMKKTKEIYDVERTKKKNDLSMEHKRLMSLNSGVYADVSELSKFDHFEGDSSSVTSDTYLDRLNNSWTSAKKHRNVNANKSKTIAIDRNIKQSSPLSALSYDESIPLQRENEKITNEKVVALNDRNDQKEKKREEKNYVKLSKKRSRSKTKSKLKSERESTSKSTVKRKSRSKSRSKVKSKPNIGSKSLPQSQLTSNARSKSRSMSRSKFKSKSKSKSRLSSRSKSRSRSRPKPKSRSKSKSKSRSRSKSRSQFRPKSRSRSTSKSISRSKSKSEPGSKSKNIQTQSKVNSSRSLKDSTIITKLENSNANEKSVKMGNKDASSSMTDVLLDFGPCITRNYFIQEAISNDIIDSDNSVYSSRRNFYKTVESESTKFPSKVNVSKNNVTGPKKNCWLSKSDNYMNSSERERENRTKNLASRKGNDCYLRFCNSRFLNSVQSLSDESSNIMYMDNSNKK